MCSRYIDDVYIAIVIHHLITPVNVNTCKAKESNYNTSTRTHVRMCIRACVCACVCGCVGVIRTVCV